MVGHDAPGLIQLSQVKAAVVLPFFGHQDADSIELTEEAPWIDQFTAPTTRSSSNLISCLPTLTCMPPRAFQAHQASLTPTVPGSVRRGHQGCGCLVHESEIKRFQPPLRVSRDRWMVTRLASVPEAAATVAIAPLERARI